MSIPVVNQNRFYDNKEISLSPLLPNFLKGGEVEEFLGIFETFLNEMYTGATKAIPPEDLDFITYELPIIWTTGSQYITSPGGTFLTTFSIGDFVRRGGETKYYKIEDILDDVTIKLTEIYAGDMSIGYLSTAYLDEFVQSTFNDFWLDQFGSLSPIGSDKNIDQYYRIDKLYNRIICIDDNTTTIIGNQIKGDYIFEFHMHRSTLDEFKNNKFGITYYTYGPLRYGLYYESGKVILDFNGLYTGCELTLASDVEDFVIRASRVTTTDLIRFEVINATINDSATYTWNHEIGYSNRHYKDMSIATLEAAGDDSLDRSITLYMINGEGQGFNQIYLQADSGFVGEIDTVLSTGVYANINPYVTQMGRQFEIDNVDDLYMFYKSNNRLMIRDLIEPFVAEDNIYKKSKNHISILEKIRRLTELHDPDLIDIEYIQYFADYLGYDVNINRETVGVFAAFNDPLWSTYSDEQKQVLIDDYLRFAITNLPTWYKIKTTDDALNIMLYSFGLVTEIQNFFCEKYSDISTWASENITTSGTSDTETFIKANMFQTPHFIVKIDVEGSVGSIINDVTKMKTIIDAISSVKPINTVFHGLSGWFRRYFKIYAKAYTMANYSVYIS